MQQFVDKCETTLKFKAFLGIQFVSCEMTCVCHFCSRCKISNRNTCL